MHAGTFETLFAPAAADEATALQDYMLAALRSFMRRYHVEVAQVADRIQAEVVDAAALQEPLRPAFAVQL